MQKFLPLFLLLLLLAEIAVFIVVGDAIGVLPTLGLTLLGMALGVILLRRQGLATLQQIRAEAAAGRAPAQPIFETALLTLAAILMFIPGFITALAGGLLFIPALRRAAWRSLAGRMTQTHPRARSGPVIVELQQDEYSASTHRHSPWRGDPD